MEACFGEIPASYNLDIRVAIVLCTYTSHELRHDEEAFFSMIGVWLARGTKVGDNPLVP